MVVVFANKWRLRRDRIKTEIERLSRKIGRKDPDFARFCAFLAPELAPDHER